jgi:outer membrane protein assembly factor BamB
LTITSPFVWVRKPVVVFRGVAAARQYRVRVNGIEIGTFGERRLAAGIPVPGLAVGAPGRPCVVGLDKATGREVWRAGKEWGPSYASPVPAMVYEKRRVFVFAGGESKPPTGGLMSIDPATGKVDFTFPWRSRSYESVNASCPVVFDNKVFVSASYRTGSAVVEVRPDFTHRVVWTNRNLGCTSTQRFTGMVTSTGSTDATSRTHP